MKDQDRLQQGVGWWSYGPSPQPDVSANAPDIGNAPILPSNLVPVDHDPFEIAAQRTVQSVKPVGGRKEGWLTQNPDFGLVVPHSPLDVAVMATAGPFGKLAKLAMLAGGAAMESDPAQAGTVGKLFSAGESAIERLANAVKGIRAYHGSPHDFDRFDLSKIGTGEGAQAYGHGLYFAENPKVAQDYRRSLAPRADSPQQWAADAIRDAGEVDALRWLDSKHQEVARQGFGGELESAAIREAMQLLRSGQKPNPTGRMYEVNINAHPDQFLDWDKSLSQQPHKESLLDLIRQKPPRISESYRLKDARRAIERGEFEKVDAPTVYDLVGGTLGKHKTTQIKSTEALREAGIPGIKYLDQGSRVQDLPRNRPTGWEVGWNTPNAKTFSRELHGGDQQAYDAAMKYVDELKSRGTSNYVLFDDKIVDIIRKYGLAGMSMLPPAIASSVKGRVVPVDHNPFEQRQ